MHPAGRAFAGTVEAAGPATAATGAGLLDRPGRHRVTVRLSKATPTPPGWPDVLGLAIRWAGWDLLLSSSDRRPLLRHLFLPRRRVGGFYSSLAAYRTPRFGRLFLGAQLDPDGRTATIAAATRFGRWRPVARLRLGRRLSRRRSRRLAFDPIANTPPDVRPVGLVQRLRAPVYRGSQAGRG
jgi:hypothetical protein